MPPFASPSRDYSAELRTATEGYPRMLDRYELLMRLARGGMAMVHLARHHGLETFDKLLAIKTIHDIYSAEQEFVKLFLDEARIAARLQHSNVVSVFEMGTHDGSPYLVMDYVHGQTLSAVLYSAARAGVTIPWSYLARIIAEAAQGLHAAHEARDREGAPLHVVHRDVSPQNVMVSYEGNVRVLDFGIASAAARLTTTRTGEVRGKMAYMSPDQVMGLKLDRRSDVFSLGIVLHEACMGRRLFKRDNDAATNQAVLEHEIPSLGTIGTLPRALDSIVRRMLARDREERYQTAAAVAEDLESLLVAEGEVVTAQQIGATVASLFAEEKAAREELIGRVLHSATFASTSPAAMRRVGVEAPSGRVDGRAAPRRSSRIRSWALVGIVTGLVCAGLVLWYWRLPGTSAVATSGAKHGRVGRTGGTAQADDLAPASLDAAVRGRPRAASQDASALLRVSVHPEVEGATVSFRGEEHPARGFSRRLVRGSRQEKLLVRAPGFEERSLDVTLEGDVHLSVDLRPLPRTPGFSRAGSGMRSKRPQMRRDDGVIREPRWEGSTGPSADD